MSKFVLFEGEDNQWYFSLKANNGETVAVSEGYKTQSGAMNGIQVIKKIASDARIVLKENDN